MDYKPENRPSIPDPDGFGDQRNSQYSLPGSEGFARKVLDSSLNGIYIYDIIRGQNVFINAQYTALTGFTLEDLNTMDSAQFLSLFHPGDIQSVIKHMQDIVQADDDMLEIEYRFKTKDGRWIWCLSRDCAFARTKEGSISQFIGTFLDISDRKYLEQALSESERKYRELVENANSVIIRWDCNGTLTFFNEYAQRFFGYSAEEVIGGDVNILLPEKESTGVDLSKLVQELLHNPERHILNINENVCRDGRRVWMAWTNKPIFDIHGKVLEILSVGIDITAHKLAEKSLKESEERFTAVLENSIDAIYRRNIRGDCYDYMSPAIRSILGFTPDEMQNMPVEKVFQRIHPEDRALLKKELAVINEGGSKVLEYRFKAKDGQYRWVADTVRTLCDQEGQPQYRDGIIRDISARKNIEEELRKSKDELEARVAERTKELTISNKSLLEYSDKLKTLNEELQEFAFVASHDLQEPLRKIQTFCDMAIRRCAPLLDSTGQEYLDRISSSADRMRQLLHDLLQYSRVNTNQEPIKKNDLGKIVHEAADLFEENLKNSGGFIHIETENMSDIEVNEIQMLRVFQNLIGNAVKYRGQDPPNIRIYARPAGNKKRDIFVEDNGIGFEQQYAERIFRPFQRLHGRQQYEGTGIGLAICRKIIGQQGGSIRAESEPEKGSTFIIRLPVK